MVRSSLALLAGAIAAQLTSFAPSAYPLDRLFLLSLAVRLVLGCREAVLFGAGVLLYLTQAFTFLESRLSPAYAGDSIVTRVRVLGFPETRNTATRFVARVDDDRNLPRKLSLHWQAPPVSVRGGDVWELVVRLKPPRGRANPGGFDVEGWLFREGVGATGSVVRHARNRLVGSARGGAWLELRHYLAARIGRVLGESDAAGVLRAITVGSRDGLNDALWERYARTGTTHLMAISGLHIGLAALAAYFVAVVAFAACRLRSHNHRLALCVSLLAAGAYVGVSGSGIPALRAFIMLLFLVLAVVLRRPASPLAGLALAAASIVLLAPADSGSAGFVLSYTAVLLLLWRARQSRSYEQRGKSHRLMGLAVSMRMQCTLLLGLLPATVLLFERYAPAAPLVNLLVVPVFSLLIVPVALLGLLFDGPSAPLGDALLRAAAVAVGFVDRLLAQSLWPTGQMHSTLGIAGASCLLLTAAWAWLPRAFPGCHVSWPALAALLMWQPGRPPAGCADVAFLDVGQGQAVVVETQNTVLLYDTGPAYPSGGSAMQSVVLPFLRHRGIRTIDVTVVSHADSDHSGGLRALVEAVPAGRLLAGEPLDAYRYRGELCHAVRPWRRDGVRFRFLPLPFAAGARQGNNASCVLEVAAGERRLLLTGDIERSAEVLLLDGGTLRPVDVVSVPHHGSGTSSSPGFVAAVDADIAIASAGYANRWGFPRPEVIGRWKHAGTRVLSTGDAGAISVRLCPEGAAPVALAYRDRRRHVWHLP